jgi:hypothetical protein
MTHVEGTYRGGNIQLDSLLDLPEGSRVQVAVAVGDAAVPKTHDQLGLDEATWVDTPENRAALRASMEAYEPLVMTLEEEAEWNATREAVKQYTIEKMKRTKLPFES